VALASGFFLRLLRVHGMREAVGGLSVSVAVAVLLHESFTGWETTVNVHRVGAGMRQLFWRVGGRI